MTPSRTKWIQIQSVCGTEMDGIPGAKDDAAIAALRAAALAEYKATKPEPVHNVKASSFADKADVEAFRRCKAQDGSDQDCFLVGDNGIGCWNDDCAEGPPMCALPPEDMEERWGSVAAAKHKKVMVVANGRIVTCILGDRMPHRENIKNGAGIDLNPAACSALGLKPPIIVKATWRWA
jgi:hypothetical protein